MKLSAKKRTILFISIGLLLVLSLNFFQKEVRGFFYSFSMPVQKMLWRSGNGVSDFFEAIFKARNLERENEELNLRIQELLSRQQSFEEMAEENKTFREALELGLQKEFRFDLAEIIGKDTNRDAILIDKGLKNGITKDLFVITSQKVLVGKVAEVYQNYSRVLLISDRESLLEAKIVGTNISGLLKGLGGSQILFDLIPKEGEIKEGDLVVSRDFLIGLIKEVKKVDVNLFQQAEISPFFEVSNLGRVFIVLDF